MHIISLFDGHLAIYGLLLRHLRAPLALVVIGLVFFNIHDHYARYERAAHWDRRRIHAATVASSFESSYTEPDVPPLPSNFSARLNSLNGGVMAWNLYAISAEGALRAAGCSDRAINDARHWLRLSFQGRRRPDAILLQEASSGNVSLAEACTSIFAEVASAAKLHAGIEGSQLMSDPSDCASPDTRVLLLTYPWNGFASNFGVFAGALMTAIRLRRVLVLDESTPWVHYGGEELCGGTSGQTRQQWECYFQRFGTCDWWNSGIAQGEAASAPSAADWLVKTGGPRVIRMSQEPEFAALFYHSQLAQLEPPLPFSRYGNAWWRTHHFLYLWRLQPRVLEAIDRRIRNSGLGEMSEQFIAWHVRHGDKVRNGRGVYRTSKYVRELTALSEAHPNITHVFLASDDPQVLEEARTIQLFKAGRLRLFSLKDSQRLGGQVVEAAAVAQADQSAAHILAIDAITNIMVLSEGSLSISIFHSNFARLASEFRYAKGYALAPYVFKDAPDCAKLRHTHIDRDSYFALNDTQWYLLMRKARMSLGLPPGYFALEQR